MEVISFDRAKVIQEILRYQSGNYSIANERKRNGG